MADQTQALRREPLANAHGGSGGVRLTPAKPASRISLRARADAVGALSSALGLDLPIRPSAPSPMAAWRCGSARTNGL